MNKSKVQALAKFIEANEQIEFNMVSHRTCAMAFLSLMEGDRLGGYNARAAAQALSVPKDIAMDMFVEAPYRRPGNCLVDIPRETVVQALRDWADTGKVPTYCPKGWDKVEA